MLYPNPALVDVQARRIHRHGPHRGKRGGPLQDRPGRAGRIRRKKPAKGRGGAESRAIQEPDRPPHLEGAKQLPNGRFAFEEKIFDTDEGVRPGTTKETLAALRPAFKPKGSVTAGNSSQTSDGAAGVVLMSKEKARELGLKPMATFRYHAVEGCEPEYMGVGPAVVIPKILKLAGMTMDQIDLIELNEAFAAQAIYCINKLGINQEITNVNGGAIALGHPLGCTGAKLTTQLVYEMEERKVRWGLVSMCIGFGMGAAAILERED
jgi:acetyl-CoA acyltransferase